jgi:hypothetical protein
MGLAVLGMVLYGYFSAQTLPRAPSTAGYTKLTPFMSGSERSLPDTPGLSSQGKDKDRSYTNDADVESGPLHKVSFNGSFPVR